MVQVNPFVTILLNNCTTFDERREVYSLTEAEMRSVNNNMVGQLFNLAIDKSNVNFDNIPNTKGDITKYYGYKSTVESLDLLRKISTSNRHKIPEIDTIEKALNSIVGFRNIFERGFKLNKDFVILQYNTLVTACVVATSSLIASYVDFIRKPETVEFTIINSKNQPGKICIDSLEKFNSSVSSGDFAKIMNEVITSGQEGLTGTTALMITAAAITGAILLVTFGRELVYYFYYSRVKIAEYLRVQALFLELNESVINSKSYNMTADKKKKVLKRQEELINELKDIADKIDVSDTLASKNTKSDIQKNNTGFKLDDIKAQNASTDNGFQLI